MLLSLALMPTLVLSGIWILSQFVTVDRARAPITPLELDLARLASLQGIRKLSFKDNPGSKNGASFGNQACAVVIYDSNERLTAQAYFRWILRHEIGHLANRDSRGTCLRSALMSLVGVAAHFLLGIGEVGAIVLALAGAFVGWNAASRRAERRADVFATEHTPPEELETVAKTFSACAKPPRLWRSLWDSHPTMQERASLLRDRLRRG